MVCKDKEGRDTDTIMTSVKECAQPRGRASTFPHIGVPAFTSGRQVCVLSLPGDNRFPASLLSSLSLGFNPVLSQSIKGSLKLHSRDIQEKKVTLFCLDFYRSTLSYSMDLFSA